MSKESQTSSETTAAESDAPERESHHSRRTLASITAIWTVALTVYIIGAMRQSSALNLSATAGGQYPYLLYAQGMAEEGWFHYVGDRNRMPLYPALLSLVYHTDSPTYFRRARVFAIASSVLFLLIVAAALYKSLPPWSATTLGMMAAFLIFLPKASFVQAELLYYSLFLVACVLIVRYLIGPHWRIALATGVACGFAYLTKASALALVPITALCCLCTARPARSQHAANCAATAGSAQCSRFWRARATHIVLLCVGFFAIAGPVTITDVQRYGRPFYNLNSTYFMWCDSWTQARELELRYDLVSKRPDAPPDAIPGPLNYWRTHNVREMFDRIVYGLGALAGLAWHSAYAKYFALSLVIFLAVRLRAKGSYGNYERSSRKAWLFTLATGAFYLLVYAWYAPVAFGDRFLLSLFLPATALLWWSASGNSKPARVDNDRPSDHVARIAAVVLSLALLGEGVYAAGVRCVRPSPEFIAFYNNESMERLREGNLVEAERGFLGVAQLDANKAAPRKHLGMIALSRGRDNEAIDWLNEALRLDPTDADGWNGLGGANMAMGNTDLAIEAFERATNLNPTFAMAWYNLGGARAQAGDIAGARSTLVQLRALDPNLANQLERLISE